jgi:hypothetical protein
MGALQRTRKNGKINYKLDVLNKFSASGFLCKQDMNSHSLALAPTSKTLTLGVATIIVL